MNIRAVLFDQDNTLHDKLPRCAKSHKHSIKWQTSSP